MTNFFRAEQIPSMVQVTAMAGKVERKLLEHKKFLAGKELSGTAYERTVDLVSTTAKLDRDTLDQTMARYIGRRVNGRLIEDISEVVAGVHHYLRTGELVPDAKLPRNGLEWSLIRTCNVELAERRGYVVDFKVMSGYMVGKHIKRIMSAGAIQWIAREIGYPRFRPISPLDLLATWCRALLSYDGRAFTMEEFTVRNAERKHNKLLYKQYHPEAEHE